MAGGASIDSGVPPIIAKFSGLGQWMTVALPSSWDNFELKLHGKKTDIS